MAFAHQSQASLDYLGHRGSVELSAKELATTAYQERAPHRAASTLGSHTI